MTDVASTARRTSPSPPRRRGPEFPWSLYLDGRIGIVAPAQLADPATCADQHHRHRPVQARQLDRQPGAGGRARTPTTGRRTPRAPSSPTSTRSRSSRSPRRRSGSTRSPAASSTSSTPPTASRSTQLERQLASQFNLMREKPGRREVRYYLMNAAKPPLDDLNARKAIAMAIDRDQINEIRNNGLFTTPDGPFDKKVVGYVKNPGFPKFNPKQAKKLADEYKAAHGGEFNVVLEHTNDPANVAEARSSSSSSPKAGIDATLKQDDQTAFIVAAVSSNFSIMLWRKHPGNDPDQQYQWWHTGSIAELRQDQRSRAAGLLDQGRGETDPAQRARRSTRTSTGDSREQVYNVWAYYSEWIDRRAEERPGARRSAAARQGRQAALPLRPHPLLGISVSAVDHTRWGRSRVGCSSSSSSSSCRRCSRSACCGCSRATSPTRSSHRRPRNSASSSARRTASTSRSSSSTRPGSATWCRVISARTTSRTSR